MPPPSEEVREGYRPMTRGDSDTIVPRKSRGRILQGGFDKYCVGLRKVSRWRFYIGYVGAVSLVWQGGFSFSKGAYSSRSSTQMGRGMYIQYITLSTPMDPLHAI